MSKYIRSMILILAIISSIVLVACNTQEKEDDQHQNPVIYGADDFELNVGDEEPNWLEGVYALDYDGNQIEVTIYENTAVLSNGGIYYLVYRAVDDLGQSTQKQVSVVIISEEKPTYHELNIYYLNDLHGDVLEDDDKMGIAKIANFVKTKREQNPENTIFLAGGDMLQGHLVSNYYDGAPVIDALNDMYLDAFVLGNHEFDWGLDKVTQYFDGTHDMQANYPLLGANVYHKATNSLPDFVEPYTMIKRGGLNIAVIGVMGYGLESSIAYARIQDYEFREPIELVAHYAEYVRDYRDADVVVVVHHGDSDNFNYAIAGLSGKQRVDALFNGHTHRDQQTVVSRSGTGLPRIQAYSNGRMVGHIGLTYEHGNIVEVSARNLVASDDALLRSVDTDIRDLLNAYIEPIESLLYDPIMTSGDTYDQWALTDYIAYLMQVKTGADVAIHNTGGTRAAIQYYDTLTYSSIYQIFPFDNVLVLADVLGSDILASSGGNSFYYASGVNSINPNQTYRIVANDYIFFHQDSVLKNGSNVHVSDIKLHELMIDALLYLKNQGLTYFTTSYEIVFEQTYQPVSRAILPKQEEYFTV